MTCQPLDEVQGRRKQRDNVLEILVASLTEDLLETVPKVNIPGPGRCKGHQALHIGNSEILAQDIRADTRHGATFAMPGDENGIVGTRVAAGYQALHLLD